MTARLISGTSQESALAQAAVDLMRMGATFPDSRISSCTASHWINCKFRPAQFWLGMTEFVNRDVLGRPRAKNHQISEGFKDLSGLFGVKGTAKPIHASDLARLIHQRWREGLAGVV